MAKSSAVADVSKAFKQMRGSDLYWCPHCGFKFASRVRRDDLIRYCWGPCLEIYAEPIPVTFVRGIGAGRPGTELPL